MPSFKQLIEKLAKEKAAGPTTLVSEVHLLLALERIAAKPIGRNKLAEELGIGEGVARTLIDRLKEAGLIEISKSGCSLTQSGLKLFNDYESFIRKLKIEKNELTIAEYNYAVLVRDGASKVKTGIEQRDAAIIAGAKSATTIVCRNGRLAFPFPNRGMSHYLKASTQIENILEPRENDAIVIVGSDRSEKAEYGVLAAALTLVDNGKQGN
jgi:predicted transcriptional regulator